MVYDARSDIGGKRGLNTRTSEEGERRLLTVGLLEMEKVMRPPANAAARSAANDPSKAAAFSALAAAAFHPWSSIHADAARSTPFAFAPL